MRRSPVCRIHNRCRRPAYPNVTPVNFSGASPVESQLRNRNGVTCAVNGIPVQRYVSLHGKLRAVDHGRSADEPSSGEWGKFRGFSAGSHPAGYVHPMALELLQEQHLDTAELRSTSWDEFSRQDAPHLDFVFTVCDRAAPEVCPVWPGQPMTANWSAPDPAMVAGSEEEQRRAFRDAFLRVIEADRSLRKPAS